MQEATNRRRSVETITARVRWASDTGVKVDGLPGVWLNMARGEFDGCQLPKRDQVWKFTYERCPRAEGDIACFVRTMEYVETVEPQPVREVLQASLPERPNFQDTEWFWTIKDERGDVMRQTYIEYLDSIAWARSRERRLNLASHRCEADLPGCTISATQVHHTNEGYRYLGAEPLWGLRAVCGACHALLTAMDKRQRGYGRENRDAA